MKKINDYKIINKENNSLNLVGKVKLKVLLVLAFIVIASFFGQLVFAGNLAVGGQKLSEIEQQINELEAQNTTLRADIAKESSLVNLAQEAQKLGFGEPSEIITP